MVKYSKELKAAEERAHAEWEQYIEKTTPEWERKSREQFLAGPKRPNSPELDLHPLAPPKILITENSIGEKSTKQGRESAMDFEMTKKAKIDTGEEIRAINLPLLTGLRLQIWQGQRELKHHVEERRP